MKVELTFYGQLTDITGVDKITVENSLSAHDLVNRMQADFPGLANKKFVIAVNNQVIKADIPLTDGAKVSFLPPFSGG